MPHAHVLLQVEQPPDKFDLESVDQFVSAEVSSADPETKALVLQWMLHTKHTRCSDKFGKCKANYPKPITPRTTVDEKGYVQMRRRSIEDVNVVEFNGVILKMWNGHANVKIASTVNVIWYAFKYIFKGRDMKARKCILKKGVRWIYTARGFLNFVVPLRCNYCFEKSRI